MNRITYERDFLLRLRNSPMSALVPEDLPEIFPEGFIPPGFEGVARIESERLTGVKGTVAGDNLPQTNEVNPTEASSGSITPGSEDVARNRPTGGKGTVLSDNLSQQKQ